MLQVFELRQLDGVFVSRAPEAILAEIGALQPGEWYDLSESHPWIGTDRVKHNRSRLHRVAIERRTSSDGPIPVTIEELTITLEEAEILRKHFREEGIPLRE